MLEYFARPESRSAIRSSRATPSVSVAEYRYIYNLLQPDMSQRVLKEKLDHVRETSAGILATGNPGCQMHIGAGASLSGIPLRVCHPVELVDQAYERAGFYLAADERG